MNIIRASGEGYAILYLADDIEIQISRADVSRLSRYSWRLSGRASKWPYVVGYLPGQGRGGKYVALHRLILGANPGEVVDHINGDTLDNRRQNLRKCTSAQNSANASKYRYLAAKCASEFKGVTRGPRGLFRAQIMAARKKYNLGDHPTPEAAAEAYDAAALKFFGEFARPNFPAKGRLA